MQKKLPRSRQISNENKKRLQEIIFLIKSEGLDQYDAAIAEKMNYARGTLSNALKEDDPRPVSSKMVKAAERVYSEYPRKEKTLKTRVEFLERKIYDLELRISQMEGRS